jgi:hypothetical protein
MLMQRSVLRYVTSSLTKTRFEKSSTAPAWRPLAQALLSCRIRLNGRISMRPNGVWEGRTSIRYHVCATKIARSSPGWYGSSS